MQDFRLEEVNRGQRREPGPVTVAGVAAAAAAMAGWAAYSRAKHKGRLPDGDEVWSLYISSFLDRVGLGELNGSWEEEWLELASRTLALYHFRAAPGDPVMVFVPGTGCFALIYIEYMYKLSREGFNVVGFDPRGHGRSSGKRGVYTLGGLVEDALAVINQASLAYGHDVPIAVSGSSQGGMVAFYCAAAEPRLAAAVCHNLIAPDEPDNHRITRWPGLFRPLMPFLPLFKPLLDTPLGELMVPLSLYLDFKAEPCRFFSDLILFFKEDPLMVDAVSLAAFHSLARTPIARKVEEIEVPVMVIHAGKDNIFPEDYVRRVYDRLTCEKEFLRLPSAHHLVMTDNVDEVVPAITAWLNSRMKK